MVELSKGSKYLKNKLVFWLKNEGNPMKQKLTLVVKDFEQKKGVDFDETFLLKMLSI